MAPHDCQVNLTPAIHRRLKTHRYTNIRHFAVKVTVSGYGDYRAFQLLGFVSQDMHRQVERFIQGQLLPRTL